MQKIYKTYGLSMKGSKSKLAERIVSLFPRATHLYDLFCGGSAAAFSLKFRVSILDSDGG